MQGNEYFFKQIISIMHGEIRVTDMAGNIKKCYANLDIDHIDIQYDEKFLKEILSREKLDIPDIIYDDNHVYCARVDFNEEILVIGPVQVVKENKKFPYCDLMTFLNCVLLIYNHMTGKELYIDSLCQYYFIDINSKNEDMSGINDKVFDTQENEVLHNPYSHECRKLESIENGDIEKLKECQKEVWVGRIGKVADNPLRQEKNIAIIVIVLASRAAIRGGVSPELAFTMADTFIMRIESMDNLMQIRASILEYEVEFADCVKKSDKGIIKNKYVEQVKNYIYKHLHSELKISNISEYVGVNKDYLSYLFHKCEGITIQNYIKREKIHQAQYMLKYSDCGISEIANYLAFSSQSYFGACFKEMVGMTPLQYRNKNSKN